ncbi:MobH family relaxase [Methylocaldum sp. 14B]|uniref:MobH family relaxase n=1 Tax=Methylocaldum sp. 14B TaxID=1912213 RepID=UPI001439206E|nr:MobH family relaxase [Methylocaldum sp. 14B]
MKLPIFGWFTHRSPTAPAELSPEPTDRQPAGALPVLSPRELLLSRRQHVNLIEELAGVTRHHFQAYYVAAINRFAEFVQQLPASEAHHHAYAGGMLDHGLEVAAIALKLRQAYLLPPDAVPEDINHKRDLWTYAVFTAALLHDLAKPAVDQVVTVFDERGKDFGQWDPWIGSLTDDPHARWYRTAFVPKRQYRLHEKASLLLVNRIIPAEGLAWLAGDRGAFSAWLSCIGGDLAEAGVMGEIVNKADGESVARNLGAEPGQRVTSSSVVPLHEKLLTALRFLIEEKELPLNRNGAAGWRVGDDLWMVSKRAVDAIRLHLVQSGHAGIPTQNDRIFDVLQEHGVLLTCNDRAVWRAMVNGDGWAHELTLIRIPVSRLWPSRDRWPDEFQGTVTPVSPPQCQVPVQVDKTLEGGVSGEPRSTPAPEILEYVTTQMNASLNTPGHSADHQNSEVKSPLSSASPDDLGEAFLSWLAAGIASKKLDYNNSGTRIHVVPEGVLLVSPGLFQDYIKEPDVSDTPWDKVQKRFLKLGLHERTANGMNVHRYIVTGQNRSTMINGILVRDVGRIFRTTNPQPNPHLRRAS